MSRRPAFVALPLLAILLGAAARQEPATSTARGAYTAAQAAEGAELYKAACAACHGERLEGSYEVPALTGRFVANWADGSVAALFDYVSNAMPQMAPGSLAPADNARIVAFLLKNNGMPAGSQPLPDDPAALSRIAFEPASKPR